MITLPSGAKALAVPALVMRCAIGEYFQKHADRPLSPTELGDTLEATLATPKAEMPTPARPTAKIPVPMDIAMS